MLGPECSPTCTGKWAKLMSRFVSFRPDGGSGWQREDVRVGSLPADHLLQKSGQLQSHQDTIQPPGKQGHKLPPRRRQTIFSFATWLHYDASLSDSATFSHFLSQLCHSGTNHSGEFGFSTHCSSAEWFNRSELRQLPQANNFLRWCLSGASAILSACSGQKSEICFLKKKLEREDTQSSWF